MTTTTVVGHPEKIQMNGRYPAKLVEDSHYYAVRHSLSLNVVLCAALAEYLAKRQVGNPDPAPQLHYRRGRPPSSAVALQEELMRVDPRGRKLRQRSCRAKSTSYGSQSTRASRRALAHHSTDGRPAGHAPEDAADVREGPPDCTRVLDGSAIGTDALAG